MKKPLVTCWAVALLFLLQCVPGRAQVPVQGNPPAATEPHRAQVDPDIASALVAQRVPIKYPDAARAAGVEGVVVLRVVVGSGGDVEEVTVLSGDAALAQAAIEAVRQWKYKPYVVAGTAVAMETQVSVNFHVKTRPQIAPPPLGSFHENAYTNEYFGLYYPMSRDWVRETELMRKKIAAEGKTNTYVLLAAVHIPQHYDPSEADSSFTVMALARAGASANDCKHYLEAAANELHSGKEGEQKGEISQLSAGGHDFLRVDFHYSKGVDNGASLCTAAKDYLLLWNFGGPSRHAVDEAVAALNALTSVIPPQPEIEPVPAVHVVKSPQAGTLVKKVAPVYPKAARYLGIQGTVRMGAVISKDGDVIDLEVLDGPIELVASAVDAVRDWKYRPYLLEGKPVAVQTEITVNYQLNAGLVRRMSERSTQNTGKLASRWI
jgi:TonB family protein